MNQGAHLTLPRSTLREAIPVVATSFVNKCGDVGMRVFPMLLIARAVPTNHAAFILSMVGATPLVSSFVGGFLGDKAGFKKTILISFAISAIGMIVLAFSEVEALICFAGMLTKLGQGMFMAPLRILMMQSVSAKNRQESFAWLRAGNNGGVLMASFVAYVTSGVGLAGLFLFDAITSIAAVIFGAWQLDGESVKQEPVPTKDSPELRGHKENKWRWIAFGLASLLPCIFNGSAELFFVGTAAQAKVAFGDSGMEVFAQVYMLNTAFCLLLSVKAARYFRHPTFAIILGFVLQTAGLSLFLFYRDSKAAFFGAALLQTIGELAFASVGPYLIMKILPPGKREGRIYSLSLTLVVVGKMIGSGVALYFIQGGRVWMFGLWGACLAGIMIALALPRAMGLARLGDV
jgi:MFS family permease